MSNNTETSRRVILQSGLGVIAAAAAVSRAKADDKLAPELVQYVKQSVTKDDKGVLSVCNKCVNWVEPNACKIVSGVIAPAGWCVAFAPKEG